VNNGVLALELYTVRDETARDYAGTLRQVAAMGYRAVEPAGYGNLSPEALGQLLTETGLRMVATHVALPALEGDLETQISYARAGGAEYLVVPWLPPEQRDDIDALARRLQTLGRRVREAGLRLAYHNHDFEFARDGDAYVLDRLLEVVGPDLLELELDAYWAVYAGVDPIEFLRRHAGHIPIIHLKDMAPDRSFADVGDGTMDMRGLIETARETGTRYFVVENDQPKGPSLESARRSLENLRAMGFAFAAGEGSGTER
jgi:sugar phosphate isomerase/epimerase